MQDGTLISVTCFSCGKISQYPRLGSLWHECGASFFACVCPSCMAIRSWAHQGYLKCTCGKLFFADTCPECGDVFTSTPEQFPGIFEHAECGRRFVALVCPQCKTIGHWSEGPFKVLACSCGYCFFACNCSCGRYCSWPKASLPGLITHRSCGAEFFVDRCSQCNDVAMWPRTAFPGLLVHRSCGATFVACLCPSCRKIGHWPGYGTMRCACGFSFSLTADAVDIVREQQQIPQVPNKNGFSPTGQPAVKRPSPSLPAAPADEGEPTTLHYSLVSSMPASGSCSIRSPSTPLTAPDSSKLPSPLSDSEVAQSFGAAGSSPRSPHRACPSALSPDRASHASRSDDCSVAVQKQQSSPSLPRSSPSLPPTSSRPPLTSPPVADDLYARPPSSHLWLTSSMSLSAAGSSLTPQNSAPVFTSPPFEQMPFKQDLFQLPPPPPPPPGGSSRVRPRHHPHRPLASIF